MTPSPHAVLVAAVEHYHESGRPIPAERLASQLEAPVDELTETTNTLCEYELLAPTETGYRPTVTGRELLATDIRLDDVVVLDVVEE